MKKITALVMTSLMILTALLTTSYFTPPAISDGEGTHWKIMLAQKYCNAWITGGYLTHLGELIPGTEFNLFCICEDPAPPPEQPLGQFVFWKVWCPPGMEPTDIHYLKSIDWDKDGAPNYEEYVDHPIPYFDPRYEYLIPEEPHTVYQHVETEEDIPTQPPPTHHLMVVVEVREQPYDPDRPIFQWQLMMKTHGVDASWSGYLTKDQVELLGTDFALKTVGVDPDLQCQVVQTEWCTVPNDIHFDLTIDGDPLPSVDQVITQFPWTYVYGGVELELTEVQMHKYWVIGGGSNTAGWLAGNPVWELKGWEVGDGVPFATRPPDFWPQFDTQNITFTQRDPITGIVKLGIPPESYTGLDHMWYSTDVGTWFRSTIVLETQGCGWIFTGVGKQPIYGSVDLQTYNNNSGVYTFGPDGVAETGDDELLAGTSWFDPGGEGAAGSGSPIGPCLQLLRGPDGIPCTSDDPIGRGDPDGPDERGSSIVFLPTTNYVKYWDDNQKKWSVLYTSPWPQLLTTGTAYDIVIEPDCLLDPRCDPIGGVDPLPYHANSTKTGQRWEFFAGEDHAGMIVPWKDKKCNAYATYVNVWSVLRTPTALGQNDVLFETSLKVCREDCVIADVNGDEKVTITDVVIAALAFGAQDEYLGPDGIPMTADDKPFADANYDARGDFLPTRGKITISDIVKIALDFGAQLTPACIVRP